MQRVHILIALVAVSCFNCISAFGSSGFGPLRLPEGQSTTGANQTSTFEVVSTFDGGMRAKVCVHNSLQITCGWRLRIRFSGHVDRIDVFGSKSFLRHYTRRSFAYVDNTESNKAQGAVSCHEFVVHFSGNQPRATAKFTRACRQDKFIALEVIKEQNSELTQSSGNGKNMWGTICIEHTYTIECGWEMVLHFSRRVTNFQMWSGVVKSIKYEPLRNVTDIIVGNQNYNAAQPADSCHGFHATFAQDNKSPSVTAEFSKICNSKDGEIYVSEDAENNAIRRPSLDANFKEPKDGDYDIERTNVWTTGMDGRFCLFHSADITCGFEADIVLTAPVKEFVVYAMGQLGVTERSDGSAIYHFKNQEWNKSLPSNKACFEFRMAFDSAGKPDPNQIKGRFRRVCDGGKWNNKPNEAA